MNLPKAFVLLITFFKADGNLAEYIGNVCLEQRIFTEPVPTLSADSALKIVAPVICFWLPKTTSLPLLYL